MTNTRPTPETDAAARVMLDGISPEYIVRADFARKLERERNEAREAKLGLGKLSIEETWRKVSEANALRAHLDDLQTLLPNDLTIKCGIERLKHERDELREQYESQLTTLKATLQAVVVEGKISWETFKLINNALTKL